MERFKILVVGDKSDAKEDLMSFLLDHHHRNHHHHHHHHHHRNHHHINSNISSEVLSTSPSPSPSLSSSLSSTLTYPPTPMEITTKSTKTTKTALAKERRTRGTSSSSSSTSSSEEHSSIGHSLKSEQNCGESPATTLSHSSTSDSPTVHSRKGGTIKMLKSYTEKEGFFDKEVYIDRFQCIVEITDLSGIEGDTSLLDSYLKKRDGFMFVYSITDRSSFERIQNHYKRLVHVKKSFNKHHKRESVEELYSGCYDDHCMTNQERLPILLVGVQPVDDVAILTKRKVNYAEGVGLSKELSCSFMEINIKMSQSIDEAFAEIIQNIKLYKQSSKHEKMMRRRKRLSKCSIC